MANPKLVPQSSSRISGCPTSNTTATDCLTNARDGARDSPHNQQNGSDCLQIVWQSYETGISSKGNLCYLTVLEKRNYTKQYSSYIKRWTKHCHEKQIDTVSATVPQALDFLVDLSQA